MTHRQVKTSEHSSSDNTCSLEISTAVHHLISNDSFMSNRSLVSVKNKELVISVMMAIYDDGEVKKIKTGVQRTGSCRSWEDNNYRKR